MEDYPLVSRFALAFLVRWAELRRRDRDYVDGQVDYQKGNEALFRTEILNGNDPALKDFARATPPKIVDHLDRALKLAAEKTASK